MVIDFLFKFTWNIYRNWCFMFHFEFINWTVFTSVLLPCSPWGEKEFYSIWQFCYVPQNESYIFLLWKLSFQWCFYYAFPMLRCGTSLIFQPVSHLSYVNWCCYRVPKNINGFLNLSFLTPTIPKWVWTSVQCRMSGFPPRVSFHQLENQQKKMRYSVWYKFMFYDTMGIQFT